MPALAETAPLQSSAENLWAQTLETLRQDGKRYALGWLEKMRALDVREGALVLGVPDRFYRDWVDDHYRPLLESTLVRLGLGTTRLTYEVLAGAPRREQPESAPPVNTEGLERPPRLNARFTFEHFVVADSNQLAAAAAVAVADNPGRAYNPLYVYGETGLGKTHLLHAVGNRIWEKDPSQRIIYLSSEQFMNEYIESVREQRMPEFRRKFREECDVLLIDDIQVLGSKEETQREFFHTFNALHELGKAIVLTSDTLPSEIPGLEERLRSRFSMGLMTDIQGPSFETRVAILQTKAAQEQLAVPDEVVHFIARAFRKNVRELEGAMVRVGAVHSLSGQPLTVDLAREVLKAQLPKDLQSEELDVETIQREVARYYQVPVEALKEDRRHKALAHARQVAMYLCRKLTKSSFPQIGERFGKDHSTVITAVRKVEKLREMDPAVRRELEELESRLGGQH